MTFTDELQVLELAAWDSHSTSHAENCLQQISRPTILREETDRLASLFASLPDREDLQQEFVGLTWHIAVIDLQTLVAFQRRLIFDPAHPIAAAPCAEDWSALTALAFGPPRTTTHEPIDASTIQSENPDLHFRQSKNGWKLHGGSPFFEVALYQGSSFLRDGYHRAYALLRAGVFAIPAVVVEARCMSEVCFDSPNFFPESILFSQRPPMVTDFLNPSLTTSSSTQRISKIIHLPTNDRIKECYS